MNTVLSDFLLAPIRITKEAEKWEQVLDGLKEPGNLSAALLGLGAFKPEQWETIAGGGGGLGVQANSGVY